MLRKFAPLLLVALAISATRLYGADVRITDSKGNAVEVRDVGIDYTFYSFVYHPDHEQAGIRAYQGDGVVTIQWDRIEQVAIKLKPAKPSQPGQSSPPRRLEGEITLKDKTVLNLDLVNSEKGLYGKTDLGDFKIGLESISTIAVLPPRPKR